MSIKGVKKQGSELPCPHQYTAPEHNGQAGAPGHCHTRLADTLGWEVPSEAAFEAGARILLKRGYA